jgi:glycine/D-amino acid oxidase-like deaminating enzyme
MGKQMYDVVIVGGGIMGSSTAFNLMRRDTHLNVVVVEMDPTYAQASTSLSMANARIQFSLKENILISQYAFKVLENFEESMAVDDRKLNIAYRREGNLFLTDPEGKNFARQALELQQDLDCQVAWWSPEDVQHHYPLYNMAGLAGGTFGSQDGHFDAYSVLMGYKNKAGSLGADYIQGEVVDLITQKGHIAGVKLKTGEQLAAKYVINCAGAWASKVARTAGVVLPVQPVKRQVFALDPAVKPDGPLPLTVLPSGLYFRTETGDQILLGKSMTADPVGFDFTWDEKRFLEVLWPELAEFVPAFDTLKLLRGWAGLYAVNTLDGNAILGEWPDIKGLYLANGFSGHGLQQAPAVGRYLTELIVGIQPTLDLSIFSPQRILANRPLSEAGLV